MEQTKYPEAFLNTMRSKLGDEFEAFVQSLNGSSPTSIRLNPAKSISKFNSEEQVPWCLNGRYLAERPSFTFDPLFHAGTYYVQEASSMFIEQVWKQINPNNRAVRVLDMCAAPGGKSTHLVSLMSADSYLVSNEIISNRNNILQQNITKWGSANCIITQNKTENFTQLGNLFDIILIDAPCSGEGLFRKDKEAVNEWSESNVALCATRQQDILQHALACLNPGGFIIYSTCTFEDAENDAQVAASGMQVVDLHLPDYGQVKTKYGYQFYPHKIKGEGFYMAVLQKEGEGHEMKAESTLSKPQSSAVLNEYLIEADKFTAYTKNDMLFAIPTAMLRDFRFLSSQLYVRHAGIFIGATKGKDFLPSHDLALSNFVNAGLPSIELSYEDAITYLRCEVPKVKPELRGWCLAKFENHNLGWMKALENRINNYFPKELRILKR
jgi:16S rRNA C967 or C1407 C5-methylase (RsmB/RsmF family)/NOL1/NOP2/fmu family ribosome biogenesis protein